MKNIVEYQMQWKKKEQLNCIFSEYDRFVYLNILTYIY